MNIRIEKPLEDVLDEMLLDSGAPTPKAVATWSRRHPEHRAAIVEFAASWAEEEHLSPPTTDELRERSVGIRTLNLFRAATTPASVDTLSALAASAGRTLDDLAAAVGIDAGVVSKLNARRIVPSSIGRAFTARIASLLGADPAAVVASWSGAPVPVAMAAFLGRTAPAPQESLAQALEKAGTPARLMAELLAD